MEIRRALSPSGKCLLTFDPPNTDDDKLGEADVLSDGALRFVRGDQKGMLFQRFGDKEIKALWEKKISFHSLFPKR